MSRRGQINFILKMDSFELGMFLQICHLDVKCWVMVNNHIWASLFLRVVQIS